MKKNIIIIGHYGSGKSEIAVNLAINEGYKAIVDLDVVNPYFRPSDIINEMKELGIDVIASDYASSNVDVPALPSRINTVFDKNIPAIFDVGGDAEGATVLGRYANKLKDNYEMIMVVNACRPLTQSKEQIIEMMKEIELVSKLKITKIINNTNLLEQTGIEDLLKAEEMLESFTDVWKISGFANILDELPQKYNSKKIVLERRIKYNGAY